MISRTVNQEQEETTSPPGILVVTESLRSAAACATNNTAEPKEEEKMSLFWRVFGGTILSITALVIITLYNNISNSINDLRTDLSREREARTGFMKKEDADNRSKMTYERIHVLEGYKADIEGLRERTNVNTATVEGIKKDLTQSIESIRRDVAGIDLLKERVTAVESVRKDLSSVDVLKERVSTLSAELRLARDETQKVQQELERNRIADIERKVSQDMQARQNDEMMKDLQKTIQMFREKLARLEGSQPIKGNAVTPAGGKSKVEDPTEEE